MGPSHVRSHDLPTVRNLSSHRGVCFSAINSSNAQMPHRIAAAILVLLVFSTPFRCAKAASDSFAPHVRHAAFSTQPSLSSFRFSSFVGLSSVWSLRFDLLYLSLHGLLLPCHPASHSARYESNKGHCFALFTRVQETGSNPSPKERGKVVRST